MKDNFLIGGEKILSGERKTINLFIARLYTQSDITMPVYVIRGKDDGPTLFLSSAIHGDEIIGTEIIRRIIHRPELNLIRGSIIAVPVVNVFAFINHTRYTPDGRDLNRSFPGRKKGSLTARLARQFMDEIVEKSDYGIDFHSGTRHRNNLPHIRANISNEATKKLAYSFGTPVLLNSNAKDGSLRHAVSELNKPVLVFEGGEASRFDEVVIRAGVQGVISVLSAIGMLDSDMLLNHEPFLATSSRWIRAPESGVLHSIVSLGKKVEKGECLGFITDPIGDNAINVEASHCGVIIGQTNLPLVNRGDGLFHIAYFDSPESVETRVEEFQKELELELDEEEFINF